MQLGYIYLLKGQYHQAFAETARAIALDPNFPIAHVYQAMNLDYLGKAAEAVPEVERAMRLDPMNRDAYDGFLGMTYSHMKRYAAAIAPTEKYLVRNPNESALHVFLTIDYSEVGREQDAIAEIRKVRRISPGYSLEMLKQRMPPMDAVLAQRWYADLSRAGLN
jgi:adenylate cyclase